MCPSGSIEDRVHALLGCSYNGEVSTWIMQITHKVVPLCTANDLVNLNLEIAEPMTFPLIWSLALVLSLVFIILTVGGIQVLLKSNERGKGGDVGDAIPKGGGPDSTTFYKIWSLTVYFCQLFIQVQCVKESV